MKNASNITNPSCILIIKVTALPAGRQGNDIGDVKFNSDGDGLGRYSVYQYQHTLTGGWEYNWIGEFGEKDNFRWDNINKTGNVYRTLILVKLLLQLESLRAELNLPHSIKDHCSAE